MLVGAYRDNDVGPLHPLMRTLEAIRKTQARVEQIALMPLGRDDISRLVTDSLRCDQNLALPLARLVHEKTGGNPFFAIQFLTALADEALLVFEPETAAWNCDLPRIRAKGFTDNVVDLMAAKLHPPLRRSPRDAGQLACLGNVADIVTLARIQEGPKDAIDAALAESVRAGLVIRLDDAYSFVHDRVQEAAYTLIPEQRRAAIHLRIARALSTNIAADARADFLFEVANQFHRSAALLLERDEKAQAARIDLRAGRAAKASAAYHRRGFIIRRAWLCSTKRAGTAITT